jgi:molybdate transport system substrate-binding protein
MKNTMAAELTVLSAGAIEPGLAKVIDAYRRESGGKVNVAFATAPEIRKRIVAGEKADVVIAPPAVLDELVRAGKFPPAERVTVGRIGIGVAVGAGAPAPKIATVDAFKKSLLDAESLVYNQASTGTYLEGLFVRLGIAEQLKAKTTRYSDFAAVRAHVSRGKPNEIGLGATTVILQAKNRGLEFVGPLPAEIQNYTAYAATVMGNNSANDAAPDFLRYLTTPEAKAEFAAAGIES